MEKLRLAVLISGRGSNLRAIHRATNTVNYPAEIVIVLSDQPEAGGLEYADRQQLLWSVLKYDSLGTTQAISDLAEQLHIDLIVLAGFMRILHGSIFDRWQGRIVNIHPSLLPDFPGLHVHERVIQSGVKISGCTVHWVMPKVDAGPIISQCSVPVHPKDTPDTLEARVLEREHWLYPTTIKILAPQMLAYRNSPPKCE